MRRTVKTRVPALAVAALLLGLAAPASADVAPRRERKTRTVESQHAPPMEQPAEPEAEPPAQQTPPSATATPDAAPPQDQAKSEPPKAVAEVESAKTEKTGSCSIGEGSEQHLAGFAALLLLLCGASLRRRRS